MKTTYCQRSQAQPAKRFYVSPAGNDANPGTIDQPLATLAGARDKVRTVLDGQGDITVYFRQGVYTIEETVVFGLQDSGGENQTVTYSAYPNEAPVFSAGYIITNWQKLKHYPDAFPAKARGRVWVADLPQTRGGRWRFRVLFNGDKMLKRASSKAWVPVGEFSGEWVSMERRSVDEKSVLSFPKGALKNWDNLEDVEIRCWPAGYTMNILGLASVDEANGTARTTVPATYPILAWPWKEMDATEPLPSAWTENVIDVLDEPGEWVLNTKEGKLYLWPEGDSPGDRIVAPRLKEIVRVEGEVDEFGHTDMPVSYLVFRGLTFAHGDRDVWTKDDAGIQHDWEMYDKNSALLRFRGTQHCLVDECRFTNSGGTGLRFDLHSQHNRVQRSLFDYLGQAGIFICGYGPGTKDVSFQNEIVNNHIHHIGEVLKHGHGVIIWQSRENSVANNLIHDGPRKAISVSGVRASFFDTTRIPKDNRECSKQIRWDEIGGATGWDNTVSFLHNGNNIIKDNECYRMCGVGYDGGVINITGNAEGNVIRRNCVHDIVNPGPDACIRLDGNGRGTLITENIIYNSAPQGIKYNDANNNVENNILIDAGVDDGYKRAIRYGSHGTSPGRIMRNIVYFSDKRKHYFVSESNAKGYSGDYNLYYSAGDPCAGQEFLEQLRENGVDTHSVSADPLFMGFANRDFRLKPESAVFKSGFRQIDMGGIGLRDDFPERYR